MNATKKDVSFVVTDLDDTIWDWLKMWHESFFPYISRIQKDLDIPAEKLKSSFKKIHQKYHTSEASYVFKELDCITEQDFGKFESESEVRKSILHEYYSNKKKNLVLYDGVREVLEKLKETGTPVVGFTESNAFFTKYRLKHLGLDGYFKCIYAPRDSGIPDSVYRHYAEDFWEPEETCITLLDANIRKPNKEILEVILTDFGAEKDSTIYIGDKLDRDIYMAQLTNITSVWAKYGHRIDAPEYQLLREVTHWTDADVDREKEFKANYHENPKPDFILEKSYSELLHYFNFQKFANG